jgi:hypothetical protein
LCKFVAKYSYGMERKRINRLKVVLAEKGIKLKHYIRKVHSYPRYTKITRQGKIEQTELFEESD